MRRFRRARPYLNAGETLRRNQVFSGHLTPAANSPNRRPASPNSYPADAPFAAMGSTPPADSMSFQKWQET